MGTTLISCRAGVYDGRREVLTLMAAMGTVFSPAGLWLAHHLPNGPLALIFAGVLAYVALRMFKAGSADTPQPVQIHQPAQPCQLHGGTGRFVWTAACTRALAIAGIGAGFLSGLLGVGGGFVIVPALKKATNAPMQTIMATSLAVITLVSASGVISTALAGRMNWQVGIPFAAGAMVGMLGGRLIGGRLSGQRLQQAFALVAGLIAIGMVAKVAISA